MCNLSKLFEGYRYFLLNKTTLLGLKNLNEALITLTHYFVLNLKTRFFPQNNTLAIKS
jgi:hypothetical protein